MQVEGKQLLDVCGYSYIEATTGGRQKSQAKNASDKVKLQIEKHNFIENVDYFKSPIRGGLVIKFTINAANHILLAANLISLSVILAHS